MSGENTEKYKNFSALIEKKVTKMVMKHGIHGNESVVTKSYDIKFIDSTRFMAISLSNLVIVFLNMKVSRTIKIEMFILQKRLLKQSR